MLRSELKAGADYAFREKRVSGSPLARIKLIQHVRGKRWKAKWIDTHPGLVDYVTANQILVPWKEHKQFLQEEKHLADLREYNLIHGYDEVSPVSDALQQVFENAGDGISYDRGFLRTSFEALNRVRARCQLSEYILQPPAFQCRDGSLRLPHKECATALPVRGRGSENPRSHQHPLPSAYPGVRNRVAPKVAPAQFEHEKASRAERLWSL